MNLEGTNIGKLLLEIKAIQLKPNTPFTWASGWKSPIYCDNRKTLSYPEIRKKICNDFSSYIKKNYPDVEVIAGVATGAIAHGILVAESLNLPFIYVRPSAKSHGMKNLIEGVLKPKQKVVVIEDLISTGKSSLNAVDALREANANVLGMCAIFTYGFQVANDSFKSKECKLHTLTNYNELIEIASNEGYVNNEDLGLLENWRKDPENWNK